MQKIIALFAVAFLLLGCTSLQPPAGKTPIEQGMATICTEACKKAVAQGMDLSAGPCLLDPMPGTLWVCDVAHAPREPVDNDPQNQCSTYRRGNATHFVEVNSVCNVIREE